MLKSVASDCTLLFQVLLQLGSDAEGSELRARMQSASLLSDMESFKAANPGAVLGDFVRWYSPRDWVDGEEKGDKVRIACNLSGPTGFDHNCWLQN